MFTGWPKYNSRVILRFDKLLKTFVLNSNFLTPLADCKCVCLR